MSLTLPINNNIELIINNAPADVLTYLLNNPNYKLYHNLIIYRLELLNNSSNNNQSYSTKIEPSTTNNIVVEQIIDSKANVDESIPNVVKEVISEITSNNISNDKHTTTNIPEYWSFLINKKTPGYILILFQNILFKYCEAKFALNWSQKKTFTYAELLQVLIIEPEIIKASFYKEATIYANHDDKIGVNAFYDCLIENNKKFLTINTQLIVDLVTCISNLTCTNDLVKREAYDIKVKDIFESFSKSNIITKHENTKNEKNLGTKLNYDTILTPNIKEYSKNKANYLKVFNKIVEKHFYYTRLKLVSILCQLQKELINSVLPNGYNLKNFYNSDTASVKGTILDLELYEHNFKPVLAKLKSRIDKKKIVSKVETKK